MTSLKRQVPVHPRNQLTLLLITLWGVLWAQQGWCTTTTNPLSTTAVASTATTKTFPVLTTRRLLRSASVRPTRSLQANTTAIDPVLATQWKLLLAFREDNVKCGAFVDEWPTTAPTTPDGWPGVTVKNNRIVSVDFSSRGLCSDDVLTIWAKFPDLTHLDISFNNLDKKTLPASWSVLTRLTYLNARAYCSYGATCTFVTAMPSEWSSLTRLTELVLDGWTVQGKLPSSWAALKNLKALTLPVGGLNGPELPPSWGQLASLTQLYMPGVITWPNNSANVPGQTLLPKAWSGMRSLRVLDTRCGNLIGQPAQNGIPIAPYLTSLTARCGGIADDGCGAAVQVTQLTPLGQMTNLVDLSIDGGTVAYDDPKCLPPKGTFPLPSQWSRMKKLTTLSLKRFATPGWRWDDSHLNKIEFDVTIPSDWSALTSLQSLDIDLSGWARGYASSPPSSFSSLKALTFLSLKGAYYNPYYGPVSNVNALAKQRAGWKLPSSWGVLTRLQTLSLYKYGMTNMQLPESYSALTNLTSLTLWGNCLQGSLPSSWGALKKLSTLSLPENEFDLYKDGLCARTPKPTGPLPDGWGALVKLTEIHLSGFSLSGSIPSSWNRFTALQDLKLARNRLKGPLPSSWSTMNKLKWVDLSGNKLNGTLPSSWSKLKSIETLDLSSNAFSGQPPQSWSVLSSLNSLNLANNKLSGTIPSTWYAIFPASRSGPQGNECLYPSCRTLTLDMSNNLLKGPIPDWGAQKIVPDVELDLSGNKLSGPLPAAAWQVGKLNISHNSISGPLPSSWAAIFRVNAYLDMSYNKFSGPLPVSWATAAPPQRHSLDLSHNKLNGTVPKAYEKFISLHLADNQLTGSVVVPKWAVIPPSQDDISWDSPDWDLSGNRLSGRLPTNVKLSASWCKLRYARNSLSGTLPAGWFAPVTANDASALQVTLDLSGNSFSGGVPGTWAAALYLNVSHNRLNGTFPKEWGKMWTLPSWKEVLTFEPATVQPVLDVSDNLLNGALPTAMYGVKYLDVHKNKLSGSVPPAGSNWVKSGFWDALQYVDLAANAFTGKKPTKPRNATFFNISGNKFSG